MRYLSVDLEMTGLDPETNQIIEFGAVLEDTNNIKPLDELPKCHCYVTHPGGNLTGNVFALDMNADIINKLKNEKELKDQFDFIPVGDLAEFFLFWLHENKFEMNVKKEGTPDEYHQTKSLNVAGKNFNGFDKKFLDKVPGFNKLIKIRHRVIDPAGYFVDWHKDDNLPSLDECNAKIGHNVPVQHTAIDDAIDVIRLLRTQYTSKTLQKGDVWVDTKTNEVQLID